MEAVGFIRLRISQSNGKDDLPLLFILGRHQEECWSSCSVPAGRSHPCEFQSATGTALPLVMQRGLGRGCLCFVKYTFQLGFCGKSEAKKIYLKLFIVRNFLQ